MSTPAQHVDIGYHRAWLEGMGYESVHVRHEHTDKYLAWYGGKWRRVYVNAAGTYFMYQGRRLALYIDGTPL